MTPAAYSARLSQITDELQAAIDGRPELRSKDIGPRLTHSFLVRVGRILSDAAEARVVALPDSGAGDRAAGDHALYLIALSALQDRAAVRRGVDGECLDSVPGLLSGLDPDHKFSENVAALGWPRAVLAALRRLAAAVPGDPPAETTPKVLPCVARAAALYRLAIDGIPDIDPGNRHDSGTVYDAIASASEADKLPYTVVEWLKDNANKLPSRESFIRYCRAAGIRITGPRPRRLADVATPHTMTAGDAAQTGVAFNTGRTHTDRRRKG